MAVNRSNSSSLLIAAGSDSTSRSAYFRRLNLSVLVFVTFLIALSLFLVTVAFIFPILSVVLLVRHDSEHKHFLHFITHSSNQAIIITFDVKDRATSNRISVSKIHPHIDQVSPSSFFRNTIPVQQRVFRARVALPKLSQSFLAYDTQTSRNPFIKTRPSSQIREDESIGDSGRKISDYQGQSIEI